MAVTVFQLIWALLLGLNLCNASSPTCSANALRSLSPHATSHSNWNLMEPFDTAAWLNERAELTSHKLHVQAMKESHRWLHTAMQKLVNTPVSGNEKIEAFDNYVKQSAKRTAEIQEAARATADWSHATLPIWKCRRFDVGGGVTVFVGDSGPALEFHPNGDIYRAVMRTGAGGALSPLWRPPYTADGAPLFDTGVLNERERWRLMPGRAPN